MTKKQLIRKLMETFDEKEKILTELLEVMCEGEMTMSFIQKNLDDFKRNKKAVDIELKSLKEHKQELVQALTNLAHTYNDTKEQVFYMYIFQGIEPSEIAFRLNISEKTINKYIEEIEKEIKK